MTEEKKVDWCSAEEEVKLTALKKLRQTDSWNNEKEEEFNREFEEQQEIRKIVDSIEEKSKKDLSYLLENGRHPAESRTEYHIRRKLRDQFTKAQKKGYLFFRGGTYEKRRTEKDNNGNSLQDKQDLT